MKRPRALRRDRAGVATIEFALWIALLFLALIPALDVGLLVIERGRVSQAVSGASLAAFKSRATVDFDAIPGYVRAASGTRSPGTMAVTLSCNGATDCTNTNRRCACLSRTATFVAASCGTSCSGGSTPGSTAGYYLQIRASQPFTPMMLPAGALANGPIVQTATVRLQ